MVQSFALSLKSFKERELIFLHDDFAEPFRGVLIAAANNISAERLNEAISLTTGICFVALSVKRSAEFMLAPMRRAEKSAQATPGSSSTLSMCVSVEAREGVTTGISAADRATTIRVLGEPHPSARHIIHPGHIFPVEVKDGGVLVKNSLPEGALDLVKAAGFTDAALFIDLLDQNGEFLSPSEQQELAQKNQIPFICLSQLVQQRLTQEPLVTRVADAKLPTFFAGELRSIIYKSLIGEGEHLALVKGVPKLDTPTIVRVQSENTFSDVFGGHNLTSRSQIQSALKMIASSETGVLLYLRKSSHGSLRDQIESLSEGSRSRPASLMREYGLGAQILRDLGVKKAIILSNSNTSIVGLESFGIEIVAYRSLISNIDNHP